MCLLEILHKNTLFSTVLKADALISTLEHQYFNYAFILSSPKIVNSKFCLFSNLNLPATHRIKTVDKQQSSDGHPPTGSTIYKGCTLLTGDQPRPGFCVCPLSLWMRLSARVWELNSVERPRGVQRRRPIQGKPSA